MLDSFKAHKTGQVKRSFKSENTDLAVISGGLTSVLQPLDVCLNKPFKDEDDFIFDTSSDDESIVADDSLVTELFNDSESESDSKGF